MAGGRLERLQVGTAVSSSILAQESAMRPRPAGASPDYTSGSTRARAPEPLSSIPVYTATPRRWEATTTRSTFLTSEGRTWGQRQQVGFFLSFQIGRAHV